MKISWAWTLYFVSGIIAHSEESGEQLKYFEYFLPKIDFLPSHTNDPKSSKILDVPDAFHYQSRSRLKIHAFNTTFHILLNPNDHLIHNSASISYQNTNAELESSPLKKTDYLVYNGPVLDEYIPEKHHEFDWLGLEFDDMRETGWASFMVLPPKDLDSKPRFRGTFSYKGEVYNIQPASNFLRFRSNQDPTIPKYNSHNSIIYRRSDNLQVSKKTESGESKDFCGVSHLHTNTLLEQKNLVGNLYNKVLRRRSDSICSSKKKILYMGVAADCSYVAKFGSADEARIQIISDWNMVSGLYEKEFNVKLGIIKIEIPSSRCSSTDPSILWNRECSDAYTMTSRLDDFSAWRAKKGSDHTGLWHLVTDCKTGTQVGLAWEGTICQSSIINSNQPGSPNRQASGTGVSALTKDSWKVIAHEIGHNFGAIHDCVKDCSKSSDKCCPCGSGSNCDCKGKYIMNPESSLNGGSMFSECSKRAICNTVNTAGTCITSSEQIPTYSFAMCGNGIREKGEECDCGGKAECEKNPCCDYKTCKYKKGAVCDDKNDSCCNNCQPKPVNTVCRAKSGECDIEEQCDGKSGFCPKDTFIPNGTPCSNSSSRLKCGNGLCTSRDNQCKIRTTGTSFATKEACKTSNEPCAFTCGASNLYTCLRLSGNFADGTECGRNAYCNQGVCEGGSWFDQILTWADNNKIFAIAIVVIISFFVLSCISSCICSGARRYKERRVKLTSPNQVPLTNFLPQTVHYQRQEFVDPSRYNGPM